MLQTGLAKATAQGANVRFVHGDMSDFDLGRRFTLIIVSCNSLAHNTSDQALDNCLASIAAHLEPSGIVAFDIVNPDLSELAGQRQQPVFARVDDETDVRRDLVAYDAVAQILSLRWHVMRSAGEDFVAGMELRAFFPWEVEPRLAVAGLKLLSHQGDFEGSPLTPLSPNQVCLAGHARHSQHLDPINS